MEASSKITARKSREDELVKATRALFDERGMQQAPIEEIARSAGIARGLIYRHFSSKEELFVLTVTDYLAELDGELRAATAFVQAPGEALRRCARAYSEFCLRYPAFLDCALALMQRPAAALRDTVSELVWLRLGRGMAACIDQLTRILREGEATGEFELDDPEFTANLLWTQVLGAMHLARIRVGMRRTEAGEPDLFRISPDDVVGSCVDAALATIAPGRERAGPSPSG